MKKILKSSIKKIPIVNTLAFQCRDYLQEQGIKRNRRKINELMKQGNNNKNPRKIVFWSTGGMPDLSNLDATFALALQLRGHQVHVMICDGTYRACVKRELSQNESLELWESHCASCKKVNTNSLREMNVPYSYIGDWVSKEERLSIVYFLNQLSVKEIFDLTIDGLHIGPNIESSYLRYTKAIEIGQTNDRFDPNLIGEKIIREYAYNALINLAAAKNSFKKEHFDKVFMSHGLYAEWGVVLKFALNKNIAVTTWVSSSLVPRCFMLRNITSLGNQIFTLYPEEKAYDVFIKNKLTPDEIEQLKAYFFERNAINLLSRPSEEKNKITICHQMGLVVDKPIWGILAHINWDAVKDGTPMLYATFNQWIIDTIKIIQHISEIQWIIKIHPHERYYSDTASIVTVIKENFPSLPAHISILPADSKMSISDFSALVNGAVTVFSTLGLELALLGKPVILAGQSHYSGKGFTYEAQNTLDYQKLLMKAKNLGALTEQQKEQARQYGYYFFIKRQIPMPIFDHEDAGIARLNWKKLESLLPLGDPFMNMVCDRIIDDQPIDLNPELLEKRITREKMYKKIKA